MQIIIRVDQVTNIMHNNTNFININLEEKFTFLSINFGEKH